MSKLPINPLYDNIRQLLLNSRKRVVQQVNQTMTMTYFEIGRMIIEHEQEGKERATYAKKTIKNLSERLRSEFGKGFSVSNLEQMRQLYLTYNNRISQTPSGILENPFKLSWSHYLFLMRLEPIELRQFYEIEAIQYQMVLPDKELLRKLLESPKLQSDRDKTKN